MGNYPPNEDPNRECPKCFSPVFVPTSTKKILQKQFNTQFSPRKVRTKKTPSKSSPSRSISKVSTTSISEVSSNTTYNETSMKYLLLLVHQNIKIVKV